MFINTVGAQHMGDNFYIRARKTPVGEVRVKVYRVEDDIQTFILVLRKNEIEDYGIFLVKGVQPYLYNARPIIDLLYNKHSLISADNTEENYERLIIGIGRLPIIHDRAPRATRVPHATRPPHNK